MLAMGAPGWIRYAALPFIAGKPCSHGTVAHLVGAGLPAKAAVRAPGVSAGRNEQGLQMEALSGAVKELP
ncbi:hypothetical protein CCU68_17060 [Pseudomonas gingeri NCPPB 3146 = LMG 5327]|uniref:Uncharacterized protein n=1 Tax=Pseudomonas gingeri NCPPB 3146 = LMG 5327 TaxID=707248 RepID=A0ABX4Y2H9_9PSED|nr:hypothetical protein CCU68_17060 [Pseudomonas gingeri NCPPB 3146 = LMG 5327]